MKGKLSVGLVLSTSAILVCIVALVIFSKGKGGNEKSRPSDGQAVPEGGAVLRKEIPDPPPPPKRVANLDRVKQNLKPGKTYETRTMGVLNVRATAKDWGIEETITINYAFEARIDREIESNDGQLIVELRHFRDLRSLKIETRLEDVRIVLGPVGDLVIGAVAIFKPEASPVVAGVIHGLDGASLKSAISALRWLGVNPEKLAGLDAKAIKGFAVVDQLTGKSVRLKYVDGEGVVSVKAVKGVMTAEERDFHFASVLLSDSLIVPDTDIKIGSRWSVDGSNFSNVIDPSLLARASGEIELERAPDHIVQKKNCLRIKVVGGRVKIDSSDAKTGKLGYFDPDGSLYFSPEDQVIIEAKLQGKAKLERFSKNHLLFEARLRAIPELELRYTCRVVDTARAPRP